MATVQFNEKFNEKMSHDEMSNWLAKELNRIPEKHDLFDVAKRLYQMGLYLGASKMLELIVSVPRV